MNPIQLTPEEAAIAVQVLDYIRSLAESLEAEDGDAPIAWPACEGTTLDFADCPGWVLAEFHHATTRDGDFYNSVRGFDGPLASLHQKIEDALLRAIRDLDCLS